MAGASVADAADECIEQHTQRDAALSEPASEVYICRDDPLRMHPFNHNFMGNELKTRLTKATERMQVARWPLQYLQL